MKAFAMKKLSLLGCLPFFLSGCTSMYMPWVVPYEGFKNQLGERRPVSSLPPFKGEEVWLGYEKRPDGIQINRVGAADRCVFAFEVDTNARRLVAWRLASKGRHKNVCRPNERQDAQPCGQHAGECARRSGNRAAFLLQRTSPDSAKISIGNGPSETPWHRYPVAKP